MKRAVLCVPNPHDYIKDLDGYSIMIVNPGTTDARKKYLLENSDYSLFISESEQLMRNGSNYIDEKVFWYTSGTTGDSKFCSFSQQQVDIMAKTICRAYDLDNNDRYVSVMPLWHAHGQGFYWATQLAGCETNYLTLNNIKQIQKLQPTFLTAVPDVLKIFVQFDLDHVRFVRSASAPLSNTLYKSLQEHFCAPVLEAFGMTEALSHCFTNPLHGEQRMGTVGMPDGIEAQIEQGHLYIKGPCVFQKDWYNTGDLACQDEKGYYKILGRSKDQINVRGIKINPDSLEQHLLQQVPGLSQVVIFGQDRVKCVYTGECDNDQIKLGLIELGKHCYPKTLIKMDEIPRTDSGKISRTYLNLIY